MRTHTKDLIWPSHYCYVTPLKLPQELLPAIKYAIDNDETRDLRGSATMCQFKIRNIRWAGMKFAIYFNSRNHIHMIERISDKYTSEYLFEILRRPVIAHDEWHSLKLSNKCYP